MTEVKWDRRAIANLVQSRDAIKGVEETGRAVEKTAEMLAGFSRSASTGITSEMGIDAKGPHCDVGYDKTRRGWHLFFFEVGTVNHGPRPHLRVALAKHTKRR